MTSINDKLGLKKPGKRNMMKLPPGRRNAAALTSAQCPACHQTGARLSRTKPGWLYCSWCAHAWEPEEEGAAL
jgi:uncharacterized Zn finger protein (UPF0148 family)